MKLLLFLYCLGLRKNSSQVHVLWEDHRNDLFINGFGQSFFPIAFLSFSYPHMNAGLLMSAGGSKWKWCKIPADVMYSLFSSISKGLIRRVLSSYACTCPSSERLTNINSRVDRCWCHHRMGLDHLQTVLLARGQIRIPRVPSANHLQSDDIQSRHREDRYYSSLPCETFYSRPERYLNADGSD